MMYLLNNKSNTVIRDFHVYNKNKFDVYLQLGC